MAARFGAKIVPFGAVGEDDIGEVVLDYDDLRMIPFYSDNLKDMQERMARANVQLRTEATGEMANQDSHMPGILPKFPGRFYYCFGKPIETKGRKRELQDRKKADELYREVQWEVREHMSYLKQKRESYPYRNVVSRLVYQAANGFTSEVPTFEIRSKNGSRPDVSGQIELCPNMFFKKQKETNSPNKLKPKLKT